MTAYEIADELDGRLDHKAANMLRQQAETIAKQSDKLKKYELRNQEQIKRIAELEKELQNKAMDEVVRIGQEIDAEPVAWMELYKGKPNNLAFNDFDVAEEPPDWTRVPLYTTPQDQADRIAELSKNVDELEEDLLKATQTNAEPVAWMSQSGNNFVSKKAPSYVHIGTNDWLPLYTTPQTKHEVSPLSDEEIVKIYESSYLESGLDEWEFDPVYFARAIEERILGK